MNDLECEANEWKLNRLNKVNFLDILVFKNIDKTNTTNWFKNFLRKRKLE